MRREDLDKIPDSFVLKLIKTGKAKELESEKFNSLSLKEKEIIFRKIKNALIFK